MTRQNMNDNNELQMPGSARIDTRPIAFCGTRGLPAGYGGFETAVDEITRRLVREGQHCDVFCRTYDESDSRPTIHRGRRLVHVPGSRSSRLDTFVSAIRTGWYLWRHRRKYRHVFWFNNANLPGILMTRLAAIPMTVNTDGLEWRRAKWSWPFKVYYWLSSFMVSRLCRSLVSDSRGIQAYYRKYFHRRTAFIPYGAPELPDVTPERQEAVLAEYGLKAGRYYLQITRFEPDNLPLTVAEGFRGAELAVRGYKMVFVGYKEPTDYARRLKALDGDDGIRVCGAIYDPEVLYTLRSNCFCYVHGNSVGGTNPALLEAMATCPRIMAIDCRFSREVLAETGVYFRRDVVARSFVQNYLMKPGTIELRRRVHDHYQWEAEPESYQRLANGEPAAYSPAGEDVEPERRDKLEEQVSVAV